MLKHLLETRADARSVWFVAWWPPVQVSDNPFTHEPATAVRVILKPADSPEENPYEPYIAFVKGDRVLGLRASAPEIRPIIRPQTSPASSAVNVQ